MSETTLEDVRSALQQMDEALDPGSEDWNIALAMLSAAVVGPNDLAVCTFTGLNPEWWLPYAERLRENGVFTSEGRIEANWFEDGGGLDFWIDLNVAKGYLERRDSAES